MPKLIFDSDKIHLCKNPSAVISFSGMGKNGYWILRVNAGENEISDEQLEELKQNPTFHDMLPAFSFPGKTELEESLGGTKIEQIQEPIKPPTPSSLQDLKNLSIREAEPIIEKETNLDLLALWHESDDRKGIKDAIDLRVEQLSNAESFQE